MKYLVYIIIYTIVLYAAKYIVYMISEKNLPNSYFEYEDYETDKCYKKINFSYFIRLFPDSVYSEKRWMKMKKINRIKFCIYFITTLVSIFTGIQFLDIVTLIIFIDIVLTVYPIRKAQVKHANYYTGVFNRALLGRESLRANSGADVCAVLPIGYTNLHFIDIEIKKEIVKIRLNRDENIAELYSRNKRKFRTRYFDLKEIENTEFLDRFINDLTFVENIIDLKSLFHDLYFSDKISIEIKDYMIGLDNKI